MYGHCAAKQICIEVLNERCILGQTGISVEVLGRDSRIIDFFCAEYDWAAHDGYTTGILAYAGIGISAMNRHFRCKNDFVIFLYA